MNTRMHTNSLLLLPIVICLLFLTPLKALADDCWIASLKVKVYEKAEHQWQQTNVERGRSSSNVNAEGHVMFSSGKGQLNIISKNISGSSSSTAFRDTSCVRYESSTKGVLKEGIMSKKKIHTAYWEIDDDLQATINPSKGCMQDPIPPLKWTREVEDFRFEGIVHPDVDLLRSLCSTVKRTPVLGHCNETSEGFSGQMMRRVSSMEGGQQIEGNEVYEWNAKKVPCECTASISETKGDVKLNGIPVSGESRINLSGATVETGRRSSVTIKSGNIVIKIGPNSSVDLSEICKQSMEKPSVLNLIIGSMYGLITKIEGKPPLEIKIANSVDTRGNLLTPASLLASLSIEGIAYASEDEFRETYEELKPDAKELGHTATAFFVSVVPHDYFYVKVDKGKADVFIGDEPIKTIFTNQHIYENLKRFVAPKNRDVVVKVSE